MKVLAVGMAVMHMGVLAHSARQPACPSGTPVQAITVVNQAAVKPKVLRAVERATVDQSLQLRAAWGTPCVRFVPAGGWLLMLTASAPTTNPNGSTSRGIAGHHDPGPVIDVDTGGTPVSVWSPAFTHEVDETLVDPELTTRWKFGLAEVCDPVENPSNDYVLDGVEVTDFAFPSYFLGGSGPWDEARLLGAPFIMLLPGN